MKLKIILVCLIATLSPAIAGSFLSTKIIEKHFEWFENNFDNVADGILSDNQIAEAKTKQFCVKNLVNFEAIKNKNFEQIYSIFLFMGGSALCLSDQESFWIGITEKLYKSGKNYDNIEYMECLQMEFKKTQPNSRLLRNFNYKLTNQDIKMCEEIKEIREIKEIINKNERKYSKFNELTCGSFDDRAALEFILNFLVLTTENDDDEVHLEIKRIASEIREKVRKIVDCMKNKLDSQ